MTARACVMTGGMTVPASGTTGGTAGPRGVTTTVMIVRADAMTETSDATTARTIGIGDGRTPDHAGTMIADVTPRVPATTGDSILAARPVTTTGATPLATRIVAMIVTSGGILAVPAEPTTVGPARTTVALSTAARVAPATAAAATGEAVTIAAVTVVVASARNRARTTAPSAAVRRDAAGTMSTPVVAA